MEGNRMWVDRLGIFASAACMVHCLAFPVILAALPWLVVRGAEPVQAAGSDISAVVSACGHDLAHGECCHELTAMASAASAGLEDCCAVEPAAAAACCSSETHVSAEMMATHTGGCCDGSGFWIHVGMLALVVPLALVAFVHGFQTHGSLAILGLGLGGMGLLIAALTAGLYYWGPQGETSMTVAGSIALVTAHLWNRARTRHCCAACPTGSEATGSDLR